MARAIITAPVARDLRAEYPTAAVWKIPNATNGALQAWCTNDREFFAARPIEEREGCTWYTQRADVPAQLRPYLVAVRRSDSRTSARSVRWMQLSECGAADFFRVRSSTDVISVKLRSEMVAGDRPVDWTPIHFWLGVADDLGEE